MKNNRSINVRKTLIITCALFLIFFFCSCATTPTGRSQFMLVSEGDEIALGVKSYQQVLSQSKVSKDPKLTKMLERIGKDIAQVANKPEYKWEFTLIDDPKTANAFALPGGKIAVYTGLLPYTENEDGLAFVIAHEVGHAIARHGGERMTQQLLLQVGQAGLGIALQNKSPAAVSAINTAYGLGSNYGVLLPFSRKQEYEADEIGVIYMAKAGYDPRKSTSFFKKMLAQKKGGSMPDFLSTHPADDKRIAKLNELIPQAMKFYKKR